MKELFRQFSELTKLDKSKFAREASISRQYVSTSINNEEKHPHIILTILKNMELIILRRQEDSNNKYNMMLKLIREKARVTNEKA